MPEPLDDTLLLQKPTPDRPLQGQTILSVDDSRFASEAVRLLCLRSGARVRRADSLASAARHLTTYRPTAALVDPGLPDGSGLDLIAELKAGQTPAPVVLAISGDPGAEERALLAGADGFLAKPVESLALFQATILEHLPDHARPRGPRRVVLDQITPDRLALHDDLAEAARQLEDQSDPGQLVHTAQFLAGLAQSAGDRGLAKAADGLAALGPGARTARRVAVLAEVRRTLDARLATRAAI